MIEMKREELIELAHAPFNVSRPDHEQQLVDLWSTAFHYDLYEPISDRWCTLGFQGRNPASDLRGAGLLSLHHLNLFLSTIGISFVREQSVYDFPLALASFSCTAMLCRYLGLNPSIIVPGCTEHRASLNVQNHFFALAAHQAGGDLLQLMHSQLLQHLARTWTNMQTPATTMMDFPIALRTTYSHLHRALSTTPRPWQLSGVIGTLQRDSIDTGDHEALGWACSTLSAGTCQSVAFMLLWMRATLTARLLG